MRRETILIQGVQCNITTDEHHLQHQLYHGLRHAQGQHVVRQCQRAVNAFRSHGLRCVYQVIRELTETGKSPTQYYLSIPSNEREQYFRSIFAGARQSADSALMI